MNNNKRPDFSLIDLEKMRKIKKKRELNDLEKQEILEAFKLFDSDLDDKLDYHELKVALKALGFEIKKQDLQKLMSDYDVDSLNGKITIDDFNEIAKQMILDRDPQEDLKKAFKLFAEDSSSKISFRNLRKISKELGEKTSDDELRAMIMEFDKDGDGNYFYYCVFYFSYIILFC